MSMNNYTITKQQKHPEKEKRKKKRKIFRALISMKPLRI
jgi:PHD/YefM family antitoxin component YafN of YafNO toxin-antitoxin module